MNENVSREIQSDQEDVIDLGKLFYKILVRWRWFIISVPLCLAAALFYCLISTPVYDIHGKVMISDTKKGELGTNVMMKELGLSRAGDVYVENEMVELRDRPEGGGDPARTFFGEYFHGGLLYLRGKK